MRQNIVYFLGAGASKSFGYPITSEIMPMIWEKLSRNDLFQISEIKKTVKEEKQEGDLKKYLKVLYPGLKSWKIGKAGYKIPSITEVLSLVDHFCLYNLPPHPLLPEKSLMYLRDLLNRAVGELLLEIDNIDYTNEEQKILNRFIDPIKNLKKQHNVTIITTNYDLVIDRAFSSALKTNSVDFGINYRNVETNELIFRNPSPLFRYFKLHGSLNWSRCELCGQYYINPYGSIIHLTFTEKLTNDNTCICNETLRLKSVIIAPSFVRDIQDSNLLMIWKNALEAIRIADRLVFIGYSLPAEDLAIKSIIMRGLNGRFGKKDLEVEVVQRTEEAKSNYINLFGKNITYFTGGLQQYLA